MLYPPPSHRTISIPPPQLPHKKDDCGETGLHLAAKLGYKDIVKVLLQHKASVNVTNSDGCTPLHLAASNGNYEVARMIVATPNCSVLTSSKVLIILL